MRDKSSNEAELSPLEAQLAALVPAARLDRDQLMFAAGRRAASRRLVPANRALAALSLGLAAAAGWLAMMPRLTVAPGERSADSPRVVEGTQGQAAPLAADKGSGGVPSSVALLGPTQFRLLQMLGRDLDAQLERPSMSADSGTSILPQAPPSYPRSLLKRYLDSAPEKL